MINETTVILSDIIEKKFNKEMIDVNEDLLGGAVKLAPIELAILLKLLEKEFKISFAAEDINKGLFNSITNIALLIEKELERSI